MTVISPNYPRISTELGEAHPHHIRFFIDFKHIAKRSFLLSHVLDKSALKRKLVRSSKNVFHITP